MSGTDLVVWDDSKLKMMQSLSKYLERFQSMIDVDQLGRPASIVDAGVILATGFARPLDELIDDPPMGTFHRLCYMEGIPTIEGTPIWEKLEFEPLDYYALFKRYRSMKDAKTPRTVFKLALETGCEVKQIELLRRIYHWNLRVQFYDQYLQQEREVQLELRRQEIEGRHARTAESLFRMSTDYLKEHPELLTPKIAMQMLDTAVKLERISAGMVSDRRTSSEQSADRNNVNINIQNGVDNPMKATGSANIQTGNVSEDKNRLTQVLNIMNTIGVLAPTQDTVVEGDIVDVEQEE